jgi:hypothetical protein
VVEIARRIKRLSFGFPVGQIRLPGIPRTTSIVILPGRSRPAAIPRRYERVGIRCDTVDRSDARL